MNLDVDELLKNMVSAASRALKERWPAAKDYATNEFKKILGEAVHIGQLKLAGKISEDEARFLMDLQRNAARSVILTIEGLGILAVEAALNAALAAVRDAVNAALGGWKLL